MHNKKYAIVEQIVFWKINVIVNDMFVKQAEKLVESNYVLIFQCSGQNGQRYVQEASFTIFHFNACGKFSVK